MITAQIENFEAVLPELRLIFPVHHKELALVQIKMPLDPQYDEYVRRERAGSLFLATVRNDGRIVGYYTAQVQPGFHYRSTLTGTCDLLYIVPDMRNRGLALPLFRCVERELKRRGVQAWYSGFKEWNPMQLDQLLPALGFIPADRYFLKWIG